MHHDCDDFEAKATRGRDHGRGTEEQLQLGILAILEAVVLPVVAVLRAAVRERADRPDGPVGAGRADDGHGGEAEGDGEGDRSGGRVEDQDQWGGC